jgi:hypothetical protein
MMEAGMPHDHRQMAKELWSRTWELLEKPERTEDEIAELAEVAFASRWHWRQAGTGVHAQRGEWMLGRMWCEVGVPAAAAWHLKRTEALTQEHKTGLQDFDFAFVIALRARVAAIAGDLKTAASEYAAAEAAGRRLAEADDRVEFERQLKSGNWGAFKA